jgi:L-alanine-DL-glutamate epimerase-like enolase superfamily enzyme
MQGLETNDARLPVVVIDAMNLAYWCGAPPSLRIALSVAAALRARGQTLRLFFDANAAYVFPEQERALYAGLLAQCDFVTQAPSGSDADPLLLRYARDCNGVIISRDHYKDHRKRFRRLIKAPERRVQGFVQEDVVTIEALGLHAPLLGVAQLAHAYDLRLTAKCQPPLTASAAAAADAEAGAAGTAGDVGGGVGGAVSGVTGTAEATGSGADTGAAAADTGAT